MNQLEKKLKEEFLGLYLKRSAEEMLQFYQRCQHELNQLKENFNLLDNIFCPSDESINFHKHVTIYREMAAKAAQALCFWKEEPSILEKRCIPKNITACDRAEIIETAAFAIIVESVGIIGSVRSLRMLVRLTVNLESIINYHLYAAIRDKLKKAKAQFSVHELSEVDGSKNLEFLSKLSILVDEASQVCIIDSQAQGLCVDVNSSKPKDNIGVDFSFRAKVNEYIREKYEPIMFQLCEIRSGGSAEKAQLFLSQCEERRQYCSQIFRLNIDHPEVEFISRQSLSLFSDMECRATNLVGFFKQKSKYLSFKARESKAGVKARGSNLEENEYNEILDTLGYMIVSGALKSECKFLKGQMDTYLPGDEEYLELTEEELRLYFEARSNLVNPDILLLGVKGIDGYAQALLKCSQMSPSHTLGESLALSTQRVELM